MKRLCLFFFLCLLLTKVVAQEEVIFHDTLNHWLTYNISGQTILDSLGVPENKGEYEYWESDGAYHQQWEYIFWGLTLWLKSDSIGTESAVELIQIRNNPLLGSSFVTTKGVRMGTSKKQALDLYDGLRDKLYEGILYKDPNFLFIGNLYEGIVFEFTDDKVSMITMGYFYE